MVVIDSKQFYKIRFGKGLSRQGEKHRSQSANDGQREILEFGSDPTCNDGDTAFTMISLKPFSVEAIIVFITLKGVNSNMFFCSDNLLSYGNRN